MPYIRHLYYEDAGVGRPVILIHCPAVSHVYWQPVAQRLAASCRCITLDIRGHGWSGLGEAPWSFTDIAADIAMLVDRLALRPRPVLVGYSSGGSICLQAALDNPGLYAGLALISGFSECSTLYLRSKVLAGLWAVKSGLAGLVRRSVVSTNHASPEHLAAMQGEAGTVTAQGLNSFLQATLQAHQTPRLHQIQQPVLLLYGQGDKPMHGYGQKMMAQLPRVRTLFVPGADHRVPTRQPARTAALLADFAAGFGPDEESIGEWPALWEAPVARADDAPQDWQHP